MPVPSPLGLFIDPLERSNLPYCITGSVAASIYGEPRLTADIDVVVQIRLRDITTLKSAFPEYEFYVPPDETLMLEVSRQVRGMFNLIHHRTQFKADIYLAQRDPLHAWALEHRRRIDLGDGFAWIAPPEYVILRKLEFLREGGQDKHIRDIRFILAVTDIDRTFVQEQVERRGLGTQWLECQADDAV